MRSKKMIYFDRSCLNINAVLGFMSGLPLLLLSSTLQAWFTKQGVDLVTIGALSLLGLPYTVKFCWAPLLDTYSLGSDCPRRFWILASQFSIFILLFIISNLDPVSAPYSIMVCAFFAVACSATQDIAIDAYRQIITPKRLQAKVVSTATIFYRLAMVVSGGLALIIADTVGWSLMYKYMVLLMMIGVLYVWSTANLNTPQSIAKQSVTLTIRQALMRLAEQPYFIQTVAFILLYKMSDAFLLNFLQPYLLNALHYSLTNVGYLVKVFGLAATICGAFCAGICAKKYRLFDMLFVLGILQIMVSILFMVVTLYPYYNLVATAVCLESIVSGASSCMIIVLCMQLCNDLRYAASQLAFLSAVCAIPRVMLGPLAGYLAMHTSWTEFFLIAALVSVPSVWLLARSRQQELWQDRTLAQSVPIE